MNSRANGGHSLFQQDSSFQSKQSTCTNKECASHSFAPQSPYIHQMQPKEGNGHRPTRHIIITSGTVLSTSQPLVTLLFGSINAHHCPLGAATLSFPAYTKETNGFTPLEHHPPQPKTHIAKVESPGPMQANAGISALQHLHLGVIIIPPHSGPHPGGVRLWRLEHPFL